MKKTIGLQTPNYSSTPKISTSLNPSDSGNHLLRPSTPLLPKPTTIIKDVITPSGIPIPTSVFTASNNNLIFPVLNDTKKRTQTASIIRPLTSTLINCPSCNVILLPLGSEPWKHLLACNPSLFNESIKAGKYPFNKLTSGDRLEYDLTKATEEAKRNASKRFEQNLSFITELFSLKPVTEIIDEITIDDIFDDTEQRLQEELEHMQKTPFISRASSIQQFKQDSIKFWSEWNFDEPIIPKNYINKIPTNNNENNIIENNQKIGNKNYDGTILRKVSRSKEEREKISDSSWVLGKL